jgi:protein-tyrosine phosphatase
MSAILAGMPLYPIPAPAPGRFAIMPRPRGAGRLSASLGALRSAGFDVLVCLLPRWERWMFGLAREPVAAAEAGLDFRELPIRDHGVPDRDRAGPLLDALAADLRAGRHVVVHCRGGIGRSSVVAAALLVRLGIPVDEAWATIATARGRRVPETAAQRRWVR